ncbi:hypothetical protein C3489_16410 [Streptomyces sp. Ru71]|uniref:hypothetical protein n=1 Tax=Streptomyces sp. Ru71 TaxID=2080746 RepID=UPI000D4DD0CF|nr:hypothetical protein [Streptomyces sp. Ru71]POX53117.1 hypothetical protein C3489_16410 [Streptomyces sp. Ru71]
MAPAADRLAAGLIDRLAARFGAEGAPPVLGDVSLARTRIAAKSGRMSTTTMQAWGTLEEFYQFTAWLWFVLAIVSGAVLTAAHLVVPSGWWLTVADALGVPWLCLCSGFFASRLVVATAAGTAVKRQHAGARRARVVNRFVETPAVVWLALAFVPVWALAVFAT